MIDAGIGSDNHPVPKFLALCWLRERIECLEVGCRVGRWHLGGEIHDLGLQDFSRLEPDLVPSGNGHEVLRAIGIAAHAGLAKLDLEDTEVAKFDGATGGKACGQIFEQMVDDGEDSSLSDSGFLADTDDQLTFGKVGHESGS